jgi:hypothetical protein
VSENPGTGSQEPGFIGAPSWLLAPASWILLALASCTPTVQVEAPKDPITINLNIKLDADVKLRVEEKAKQDVQTKSIF